MEKQKLLRRDRPRPDESLPGYILRLAEMNGYKKPNWILGMAGTARPSSGYSFLFDDALDLDSLSKLTDAPRDELAGLSYPPAVNEGDGHNHLVFGVEVPRHIIRVDRPRVCPVCLAETGYARRIWELAPVTACPLHQCLLLETCPNCRRPISWSRDRLSFCPCGCDLRLAPIHSVRTAELRLTDLIYERCGLPNGKVPNSRYRSGNPLDGQDLQTVLEAVLFIAGKGRARRSKAGISGPLRLDNEELHKALAYAFEVFESWPENFHRYLDTFSQMSGQASPACGLHRCFDRFYPTLYRRHSDAAFGFIRTAFEDYLANQWDGGLIHSRYRKLLPNAFRKNSFATKSEAAKKLNVSSESVDDFVEKGLLSGSARVRGKRRLFRIERSSLNRLRTSREGILTGRKVCDELHIDRKAMADLTAHGLLTPIVDSPGNGLGKRAFTIDSVRDLLARIVGRLARPASRSRKGMIGFHAAVRRLTFVNCGTGKFLREILAGSILPRAQGSGKGLSQFLFDRNEVMAYVRDEMQKKGTGVLSAKQAAGILGMKKAEVPVLARIGLLQANHPSRPDRRLGTLIEEKSIEEFRANYESAVELARKVRTTSGFLIRMLRAKGVPPIAGRETDRALRCLYRKVDLEPLNLREIVKAARRTDRRKGKRSTRLLNSAQAADAVGISRRALRDLVRRGEFTPRLPKGSGTGSGVPWRFCRFDLMRYRRRRLDARGVVSSGEAARMLGEDLSWFYKKWVQTGRLPRVPFKDELGRHFFRRSDIEYIVAMKNSAISGPVAAKILGIHRTAVHKITKKGMLRAISGPGVDGFGVHLYLRKEIEAFRNQRELANRYRVKPNRGTENEQ